MKMLLIEDFNSVQSFKRHNKKKKKKNTINNIKNSTRHMKGHQDVCLYEYGGDAVQT